MSDGIAARAEHHLAALVKAAPGRAPGSEANRRATDYVTGVLEAAGWSLTRLAFRAQHWRPGRARLVVDGREVPIPVPPYARPGTADGAALPVSTLQQLIALGEAAGRVIVLDGELAQPCFPKAFPFVQDPDQQARIAALEAARPSAVLAVVPDDSAEEPVFEDPDLAFPYATVARSSAATLHQGAHVELALGGELAWGEAVNVSAGRTEGERNVVCAHLDSKPTTPGALDNAGGVAALLALAETGGADPTTTELVFFNGEDHYAAPGEQAWLYAGGLDGVRLAINVDGAGLRGYPAAVSTIGVNGQLAQIVTDVLAATAGVAPGEPWFESDHAVFAMRGIPAIAITSGAAHDVLRRTAHAGEVDLERVDPQSLAAVVRFVRGVLSGAAAG